LWLGSPRGRVYRFQRISYYHLIHTAAEHEVSWMGDLIFVPILSPTFGTERDRKGLKGIEKD
jgi:hypothetical protein